MKRRVADLIVGYTPVSPRWVKAVGFFFPMFRIKYEGRMAQEHFARVRRAQRMLNGR